MNRRLFAYRKMLNITQSELAEKIGISLTSYSFKESGKREFTQNEMILITDAIKIYLKDITMDEIFFKDDVSKVLNCNSK